MLLNVKTVRVSPGWYVAIVCDSNGREVSRTPEPCRSPLLAHAAGVGISQRLATVALRNAARLPRALLGTGMGA